MIQYTKYYWVVITLFLIYLPTFFMTAVLVIILAQMDKFEAKLKRSCAGNGKNNSSLTINMKYRRRIVKILFTYLLTSIICWTPLQFTIIYRHFRTEPIPSPWFFELAFFSQLSASLTGAMNPIIFGFLSQPFRKMVAKSFMFKFLDKIVTTNNGATHQNNNNHENQRGNEINLAVNQAKAPDRTPVDAAPNHNNNHHHHHHHHHHNHSNPSKQITPATSKRATSTSQNQHQSVSHNPTAVAASSSQQVAPTRLKSLRAATRIGGFEQPVVSLIGSSYLDRNKRVSFNTSPPARAGNQTLAGIENAGYEREPKNQSAGGSSKGALANGSINDQTSREPIVHDEAGDTPEKQAKLEVTTSFIQQVIQMRPLSFVSMDSINIEENLADDHIIVSDDDDHTEFKRGAGTRRTDNNVGSINGELS